MRPIFQILAIVGAGCLLTLQLLIFGLSITTDDGATHVVWYSHFAAQFWSGDVYPRWLAALNNGLGSPAFFYYPPIPYFITSLLRPLFPHDGTGIHQLGVSASLSVTASGVFTWLWNRQFVDGKSAVIGGVLFMLAPYHLAMDLYVRSSFAELWAFAWIPLVLYFVHKLASGNPYAAVGVAVSYTLLIATHLPTTLIFSPIPPLYALVAAGQGRKVRAFIGVSASMAVGVGLSAIFLYPAMATQSYVFIESMSLGHFSYSNWLFFSNFYFERDVDLRPIYYLFFVLLDLTVLSASCYLMIRRAEPDKHRKLIAGFWAVVAVAAIVMMTDLSRPIWYLLPPLQKIQFPWRFGVVMTLAATAICTLDLAHLRQKGSSKGLRTRMVVLLSLFFWLPYASWGSSHYSTPVKPEDLAFKDKIIREGREVAEYRPRWSQTMAALDWNTSSNEDEWGDKLENEYESLIKRTGADIEGGARAKVISGSGNVEVVRWEPRDISLHISAGTPLTVRVGQFFYPGWQAEIDGGASLSITPSDPDGLLDIEIPAGDHQISIILAKTPAESVGEKISLASLAVLAIFVLGLLLSRIRTSDYRGTRAEV